MHKRTLSFYLSVIEIDPRIPFIRLSKIFRNKGFSRRTYERIDNYLLFLILDLRFAFYHFNLCYRIKGFSQCITIKLVYLILFAYLSKCLFFLYSLKTFNFVQSQLKMKLTKNMSQWKLFQNKKISKPTSFELIYDWYVTSYLIF